jgi:endonuclease/exonuclease/phosphatase family metal-dependent hydrolase
VTGRPLRVLTFNIHGGRPRIGRADLAATARAIAGLKPDLAGLQEVHRFMPAPYVFQNQPARLRQLLGLEVCFRKSFGFGPIGYGNAILGRAAPERLARISLPGGGEPRSLLVAEFVIQGQRLTLFNTHLGLSGDTRRMQTERIVEEVTRRPGPAIVLGDWNAHPDSPEVALIRDAGLVECAGGDVLTFPCDSPRCRLDHIMVSEQFEVTACWTVATQVSDHLPLVADVVLKG